MLDPRVRDILLALRAERLTMEDAARALLDVRRQTGCLTLMVSGNSSAVERTLVDRYTALATAEFGTP